MRGGGGGMAEWLEAPGSSVSFLFKGTILNKFKIRFKRVSNAFQTKTPHILPYLRSSFFKATRLR